MEVSEWVETVLPSLHAQGLAPLEFIQHAGTTVYVPPEWGHAVLNYGDVLGVAAQVSADLPRQLEQQIVWFRKEANQGEGNS